MATESCLFCDIIAGKIPASKIYEDDTVLAFLDLFPIEEGHTLVIPKYHAQTLFELPESILIDVMPKLQQVANHVMARLGCTGMTICQNNGASAGQTVGHVHFHLIPRWDDRTISWEPQGMIDPAVREALLAKLNG